MDQEMVFSKLAQVVIDVQKSGLDVDLALGLPYCRLNGGAHLETGKRNGNGGAAINNSVFTQRLQLLLAWFTSISKVKY